MEPRPPTSARPAAIKATTLVLAIIATISVSGFFMGLRQSLRETDSLENRDTSTHSSKSSMPFRPSDWSHIPLARSYRELAEGKPGPNSQWTNRVSNLAAPSAEETAAWLAIPAAERREHRHIRRAYDGAPPIVPHPIDQHSADSCLECHAKPTAIGTIVAPQMSHELHPNCIQCHVSGVGIGSRWNTSKFDLHTSNSFGGYLAPTQGERAHPFAPPTIPHTTRMRENCLSCHGDLGSSPIRTAHPDRQSCTQCHVPSADVDQHVFFESDFPVAQTR